VGLKIALDWKICSGPEEIVRSNVKLASINGNEKQKVNGK
jgi:hypothetical protein